MKRTLVALVVIIASVFSSLSMSGALHAQTPDAIVKAAQLNLRAAPNTRAAIITTVNYGTELTLKGRNKAGTWLFVATAENIEGWVLGGWLEISNRISIMDLPILDVQVTAPAATSAASTATNAAPSTDAGNAPPVSSGNAARGGFELGGQIANLGGPTMDAMRRAGMIWIKRQAFAGDGAAIGWINEAHGNGFKILLSVIGEKNSVTDEGYQNSYAGYVGQLAAAGADAIEVWNEQNIDREWKTGSISPAIYVSLLAKSYNTIKSNNPNTIVITGAPAPTGAEGAFGLERVWNDDRYYTGMAAAGAGRYADCIGVHYNEGIVGPNQSNGDPRGNYPTRYFSTMLNRALAPFRGKKACFTELGYLSSEGYPPLPGGFAWAANTTVGQHAAWLAQAASLSARSGRVRLMIVFNVDFSYYGEDPQGGFAIIRPGGGCPACDTLGSVMR